MNPLEIPSGSTGSVRTSKNETRKALNKYRKSKLPEVRIAYCQKTKKYKRIQNEK